MSEQRSLAQQRRFARRARARRWSLLRRLLVVLAVIAVIGLSIWLVFFSSVLAVQVVKVQGVDYLQPAKVEQVAAIDSGEPLARVDLDRVESRVESLAAVKSAEASRSWPDGVLIEVTEREAVAVADVDGDLQGLDAQGYLFRRYKRLPADLPRVDARAGTGHEALVEAANVVSSMSNELRKQVAFVRVRTIDRISMRLRDGRIVIWGSSARSDEKADVLAILLEEKASIYDVSVPGQPTTKD